MKLKHFHVGVADLPGAVQWFDRYCDLRPAFQTDAMAYMKLEDVVLVLDKSEGDVPITIAVATGNVDQEHARLVELGVETLSAPTTQKWGVRSAYVRGPGRVCLELEQAL